MATPCLKILILLWIILLDRVDGHGRLIDPPQRSTMWRYGFKTPPNYNDNELNCGGFRNQYDVQGGRCGVCGDPYQGPRSNEAGGRYATGTIVRKYDIGHVISVTVELTANHLGWFEFKICPNNDATQRVSQHCLDQHILEVVGHGTRYMVKDKRDSKFRLELRLPHGLFCSHCVMQWKYFAGNNEGFTEGIGQCKGCGPQETFINCADVSIGAHESFSFLNSAFVFPELTPPATVPTTYTPTEAPFIPFMPSIDIQTSLKDIAMAEMMSELDFPLDDNMEFPDLDINDVYEEPTDSGFPQELLDEFIESDVTMEFWDDVEEFLDRSSDAVKAAVVTSAVDLFPTNAVGITKFHDLIKLVLWFQGIKPPSSKTQQTSLPNVVEDRLDVFNVINKIRSSDNLEDFFSRDVGDMHNDDESGIHHDGHSREDSKATSRSDSKSTSIEADNSVSENSKGTADSSESTSSDSSGSKGSDVTSSTDSRDVDKSTDRDSKTSDSRSGSKDSDDDSNDDSSNEGDSNTNSDNTDFSGESRGDVMTEVVGAANVFFGDTVLDTILGDGESSSETDPETDSGEDSSPSNEDSQPFDKTISIELENDRSWEDNELSASVDKESSDKSKTSKSDDSSSSSSSTSHETDSLSSSVESDSISSSKSSPGDKLEVIEDIVEDIVEGPAEVVEELVDVDLSDGAKAALLHQTFSGDGVTTKAKKSVELAEQMRQQLTRVFLENPLTPEGVCKDAATKPDCHSMDIWKRYPVVDSWCFELCPNGFCPNYICDCKCPAVCRALPELQFTSNTLDEWCRTNCEHGTCPKYICTCT